MYSRNLKGQRERPLQIPENYGGSLLFPNTRMPNPPPIYKSDERTRAQASHHKENAYVKARVSENEKRGEHREDAERQSPKECTDERRDERPWYDGNVRGLRGESECDECEHRDEHENHGRCDNCDNYDECDNCDNYDRCDEHSDYDRCNERDRNEHHGECEQHDGHEKKCQNFPALLTPNFLPLKLSEHFPFGHGLGFEELFLLGLILVLFKEQADEQIIALLIALLFCG